MALKPGPPKQYFDQTRRNEYKREFHRKKLQKQKERDQIQRQRIQFLEVIQNDPLLCSPPLQKEVARLKRELFAAKNPTALGWEIDTNAGPITVGEALEKHPPRRSLPPRTRKRVVRLGNVLGW